jgi:hypothetical protein
MLELLRMGPAVSDYRTIKSLFEILRHSDFPAVHALTLTFNAEGPHSALDLTQPAFAHRLASMALPEDLAQRLRCVRLKFEQFSQIRGCNRLPELLGMVDRTGVFEVDFGAAQVVE